MDNKVSIIIPVYNVEKYIRKCLDSVVCQSYKNLEILLIDDGSTDDSGNICDEYAKKDNRIKVIHKQNGGLSSARNAGLDIATGKYIAFIDSDDYIEACMIEALYKRLCDDGSDMALCNFLYVDLQGNDIKSMNQNSPIHDEVLSEVEMYKKMCDNKNWYYVVAWNKLYKREIFDNIRFIKGKIHEDEFIIHHIIGECKKISCISRGMYYYVQRNTSITGVGYNLKNLHRTEACFERVEYFINKKLYSYADTSFLYALINIFTIFNNVKAKKSEKRKEFKRIKKMYNKVFFRMMKCSVMFKRRILYILCYINFGLGSFFADFKGK